jgi:hypothetical protein
VEPSAGLSAADIRPAAPDRSHAEFLLESRRCSKLYCAV